jgi:hypothetical protein
MRRLKKTEQQDVIALKALKCPQLCKHNGANSNASDPQLAFGYCYTCAYHVTSSIKIPLSPNTRARARTMTGDSHILKSRAVVETRIPLGLHSRIPSLFTHQPALILRISIVHTHTYLFFADRPHARFARPSIHPSMSHWHLLVRFHILYPFV